MATSLFSLFSVVLAAVVGFHFHPVWNVMSLIQIYVNNQGESFILWPQCSDFIELSKSLQVSKTELVQSHHEFPSLSLIFPVCFPDSGHVIPLFPLACLSPDLPGSTRPTRGGFRLKWLLKYPSPQITSLVVLIPSFGLMKLYAPRSTTKMLANVF